VNIPSTISTLLIGIVLTLASLWYGQNHGLMPIAASDEARDVDNLFNAMMTVSTGLFLIVQGSLVFCAIYFRRRKGDNTDGPGLHGNVPLEILWTAIPAAIVVWISIYSFEIYNSVGGVDPMTAGDMHAMHSPKSHRGMAMAAPLDDKSVTSRQLAVGVGASPAYQGKSAELEVNVTGLQYAWIFSYPGTNVTTGELHLPVGQEVQVNLSANDVLHAFWVPQLRLKQDAIPGRTSQLRFTINRAGEYPLRCAELCGSYHGSMVTKLIAHTPEDFQTWLQSQQVASQVSGDKAIALSPTHLSDSEYLAPYAQEMGVDSQIVKETKHHNH
jgi:cytochrome c oxidase subunit II